VAYEERKVIGALTGIGGISDRLPAVLALCGRPWRPECMLEDSDPEALVRRALEVHARYPGIALESQSGADKPPGWDHLEALRAALGRSSGQGGDAR